MSRSDSLFFRSVSGGDGPAAVAADQRARLLDGITRVVVRKGYARTTVADVVELAGVSRRTFYEQFADKEACFLTAYEMTATVLFGDVAAAVLEMPEEAWRDRLHRALETYTRALAADPEVARLYLVDVLGAGPRAVEMRRQVLDRFVDLLRGLRAVAVQGDPQIAEVGDALLRAFVGGMNELVSEHIHLYGPERLAELVPTLEDLAYAIIARSRLSTRD